MIQTTARFLVIAAFSAGSTAATALDQWFDMSNKGDGSVLVNASSVADTGNRRTADVLLMSGDKAVATKIETDCGAGKYRLRRVDGTMSGWASDDARSVARICQKDFRGATSASEKQVYVAKVLTGENCRHIIGGGFFGIGSVNALSCTVDENLPDGTLVSATANVPWGGTAVENVFESVFLKGSLDYGPAWSKYEIDPKGAGPGLIFSSSHKMVTRRTALSETRELVRQPLRFDSGSMPWIASGNPDAAARVRVQAGGKWTKPLNLPVWRCGSGTCPSKGVLDLERPNIGQTFADPEKSEIVAAFHAQTSIKVEIAETGGRVIESAEFRPPPPAELERAQDEALKKVLAIFASMPAPD